MRLIDADALWEIFREKQNSLTARCGGYRFLDGEDRAKYDRLEITLAYIENAPTIDAVPVVRCKDCAKRRTEECALYCGTEHFRGGREVMTWCGAMYNDEFGCVRGADMRRESEVKE